MKPLCLALIAMLGFAAVADAQIRGLGRVSGSVVDDEGGGLADVAITATLSGQAGSIKTSSNEGGAWTIGGIAKGEWEVLFEKRGYGSGRVRVHLVVELARVPHIKVTMKKASAAR